MYYPQESGKLHFFGVATRRRIEDNIETTCMLPYTNLWDYRTRNSWVWIEAADGFTFVTEKSFLYTVSFQKLLHMKQVNLLQQQPVTLHYHDCSAHALAIFLQWVYWIYQWKVVCSNPPPFDFPPEHAFEVYHIARRIEGSNPCIDFNVSYD